MSTAKTRWILSAALISFLGLDSAPARADLPRVKQQPIVQAPPQHPSRDPVGLARRDPEIAKMIVHARGGQSDQTGPAAPTETSVQVSLGGQCGFAGCSSTTLVVFTFKSQGANTNTHSVLALVSCPPVPTAVCQVAPAEVRPAGGDGAPQR